MAAQIQLRVISMNVPMKIGHASSKMPSANAVVIVKPIQMGMVYATLTRYTAAPTRILAAHTTHWRQRTMEHVRRKGPSAVAVLASVMWTAMAFAMRTKCRDAQIQLQRISLRMPRMTMGRACTRRIGA